ncbi:MAG: succinate dehydrogenase, hydrophobic membrane anchor protein [Steroidobacteraceae bacterium]
MSLRSPLGKVLGMGAAKEGSHHWWVQRVSSVGLLLLAPWFLLSLIALGDLSYSNVVSWIAAPINTVLLSLLVVTVCYHAQLGLQVVVEDYVAHKGIHLVVMLVINFALVGLGVLGVFSVLRIALLGSMTGNG